MSDFIDVKPTGTAHGDTAAIQAAVDQLSFPLSGEGAYRVGTVRLSGKYYLNKTITTGKRQDAVACRPVLFDGCGHTSLVAADGIVGVMLRIGGSGRCRTTRVKNITMHCNEISSGIEFVAQNYCSLMSGALVLGARGYGVKATSAWESHIDNCQIFARGVGLWADDFNSSEMSRTKFGVTGAYWPDDLPEYRRAAISISGGNAQLRTICIESCKMGDKPLVWMRGHAATVDGMRWEKNANTDAKFVFDGSGSWGGCGLVVSSVSGGDNEILGPGGTRCAFKLTGTTRNVIVRDSFFSGLSECVVDATKGQHTNAACERVTTRYNEVSEVHSQPIQA